VARVTPKSKVAGFCAAQWPDFTPPLTPGEALARPCQIRSGVDRIEGFEDWEEKFRASSRSFAQAFQAGDSVRVLSFVFDRLYVLRNQLVHGGSTWNSGVNRAQVRDGAAILAFLMPVFVDLMMENPHEDWGRPFYPVVE
jgi:hypothetical protein